jgi:quinoprotein glucose dehydrogenase
MELWRAELARLADTNAPVAEQAVVGWLDRLLAGQVPRELLLEVLEVAERSDAVEVTQKLERYDESLPKDVRTARHRDLLYGGNTLLGRKVFFEKSEANCAKCHKAEQQGGEIGPPLAYAATNLTREFILESLFWPDAHTTPGYETISVLTKDRMGYNGILKRESEAELVIDTPDDGLVTIQKADVAARRKGLSLMPDGLGEMLSRRDLRDLIEYVTSLPQQKPPADTRAESPQTAAAAASGEAGF